MADHIDTTAITSGRGSNQRALATPLWSSAVWESESLDAARRAANGVRPATFYSRYSNPTVAAFESAIAEMEGAEAALAFASGMGALATLVFALCSPGDHIVAQRHLYGGSQMFLQGACARFGIEVTLVDGTQPGAFTAAVRPGRTMLVLAESPANPQMSVVDFAELASIVGPFTVVDSTLATPALQQPVRHGVDLVLHSATKGICGHNDATLGILAGERDLIDDVWRYSVLHGAVPSPHDALNALRGLRTLPVRIERQSATAAALAEFLVGRPEVQAVHCTGLASHPQKALVDRQMRLGGSMLSFELADATAARRFLEHVQLARLATSLGGPETLVTAPALTTHAGLGPDELIEAGITPGMVRVSVGLEHVDDLVADFDKALNA